MLLDVLLPAQCVACDEIVEAPGQFCAACFKRATFIGSPCCDACGMPFGAEGKGGLERLCDGCLEQAPPWGLGRAALIYNEQSRRLLLAFKYGDRPDLARALAPLMARAGAALLARADLLVPVPLHRRRLLGRRYNQTALLARALARSSGRPAMLDGLLRVRSTEPLGMLSAVRRRAVLDGAFSVNPARLARIQDARVVLVDDVLTTGATAQACTRVLLEAGAGGVDVLAAARTPDVNWR